MSVTLDRRATAEALGALGVVAVIRLNDATRVRAVVDALAEGGVRAVEVTMTVPGAVGLGSALVDAKAIDGGRLDIITANARRVVGNVAAARGGAQASRR